jgi:hypothetical protein
MTQLNMIEFSDYKISRLEVLTMFIDLFGGAFDSFAIIAHISTVANTNTIVTCAIAVAPVQTLIKSVTNVETTQIKCQITCKIDDRRTR